MVRWIHLPLAAAIIILSLMTALGVSAQASLDPAMVDLWNRTDKPVADLQVDRSWLWGPQANHILSEPYTYSQLPDNQRLVAYFDKSRMEVNNPEGDPTTVWYITNGRLVWEMMTGRIQIGQDPDRFDYVFPAQLPVAGDLYSWGTPSYQALGRLMGGADDQTGQTVLATVDQFGSVGANLSPPEQRQIASYVTYTSGDGEIGHNIPDVFWAFMTEDINPVAAPADWLFVMGYPLTEAYWTTTYIGENQFDVMVQCFERRCLTYNPANNEPFKVEMGNVGLHYYTWRYEGYNSPCPEQPRRGFGILWTSNDSVRSRIGCAEPYIYGAGERAIPTAYQEFEHGSMLWIDVQDDYYPTRSVLVLYEDGSFERYEDTWYDDQPVDDPSIVAPPELHQPKFGFGKIWREVPGVRDRLGWALDPETASSGVFQRFNFGVMIWREREDLIWVFYGDLYWNANGGWEVYEDTFDE